VTRGDFLANKTEYFGISPSGGNRYRARGFALRWSLRRLATDRECYPVFEARLIEIADRLFRQSQVHVSLIEVHHLPLV
jgi:hypothetical protein